MRNKTYKFFTFLLVSVFSLSFLVSSVNATAVAGEDSVYDDFEEILLKPDPDAYWWVLNWGDDQRFEDYCSDAGCVLEGQDQGVDYADFVLYPDETPGYYTNVEMAELPTGYGYGEEGLWEPTFGHPVILEARVRWQGGYTQDGSGAIGTTGIWLWNSPADLPNNTFHPTVSMGFSLNDDDTVFAKGLAAGVFRQTLPVGIRKPLFNVDVNDWVDLKMKWQRNLLGTQTVHFWINDCYIGSEWLQIPIAQALSLELWNDNQVYKLLGTEYLSPEVEQHFQIDYINIYNL